MTTTMTLAQAINQGLSRILENDQKALLMGEDIGSLGGVFRVTEGLKDQFGARRVVDSPLGESGIIGTSIGLAMRGYRPIDEIQFDGFVYPGFNQITTQLAKIHKRSDGHINLPLVIRIPYGGGIGSIEHHSESPESYFTQTPGLRVMTPSTPHDAYWMIQEAARCEDPVIFFEPKRLYWNKGEVNLEESGFEEANLGANIVREGHDATIATYGPRVSSALVVAQEFSNGGKDIEVIDLRLLSPIDFHTIENSVKKTGRLMVVHEAPVSGGLGAEIASGITEEAFYYLEAPILRVGGFSIPYPVSKIENYYLPNVDKISDGLMRLFEY